MKKVRVTYKHPVDRKTGMLYMTEAQLKYYRSKTGRKVSPYKVIRVIK